MKREAITIVSGIPPGESGTGRMMQELVQEASNYPVPVSFLYRHRGPSIRRQLKSRKYISALRNVLTTSLQKLMFVRRCRALLKSRCGKVLLMHPQTLGFELTNRFLMAWPAGKSFIYILDSSYFCVRSYNYIPGEHTPCLRCLGGDFEGREKNSCKPFPVADEMAANYTRVLYKAAKAGKVKFLAQNETQKMSAQRHFGSSLPVQVVGLWGQEWTEPFATFEAESSIVAADPLTQLGLDPKRPIFVIHSFYVPAKGADWFLELASRCPDYQFICPFPRPRALEVKLPNVVFKTLTWDSGLRDVLGAATATFVPSLWSTPIEGAMVKSIVASARVAVVRNESSHQLELPDNLVLRLSGDPSKAAGELEMALASGWETPRDTRKEWARRFRRENEGFASNLLEAVANSE